MSWLKRFSKRKPETGGIQPAVSPSGPEIERAMRVETPEAGGTRLRASGVMSATDVPRFSVGDRIADAYEVKRIIEGGMGTVYVCYHERWKMDLVVKVPKEDILSDPEHTRRIEVEAEAWTDLGLHPHIAYCYYVHPLGGVPLLVIEYLGGGNLRDWIAEGRCADLKVGLDLAIQFCHGLEHAHSRGLIHRDIKPENILLASDGTLKITDFGIVRREKRETGTPTLRKQTSMRGFNPAAVEQTMADIGTADYMPPEQCEPPYTVDVRADIYSFGVCLYEMVCGTKPYGSSSGAAPVAVLAKLDAKEAHEPAKFRDDIPSQLSDFLKRCCALDREQRPGSVKEVRQKLCVIYEDLFHQPNAWAELPNVSLQADGWNNRALSYLELGRETEAGAAWQAALELEAGHPESLYNLGTWRWQKGESSDLDVIRSLRNVSASGDKRALLALGEWCLSVGELREAEEAFKRASKDDVLDAEIAFGLMKALLGKGEVEAARSLLDRLGLQTPAAKLLELPRLECLQTLEGHTDVIFSVAFSPYGGQALSGGVDRTLRLWEIASGKCLRTFEGHTERVSSVAFSPEGGGALSGGGDATLRFWDVASGRCWWILEGHTGAVASVAFSPDGRWALSGSEDKTIRLWEFISKKCMRTFQGHTGAVTSVAFSPDGRWALSGSEDTTIRLWEAASGKCLQTLDGHTSTVTSAAFSPDGRWALSGSGDKTLRLWEVASKKCVRIFQGHTAWVTSVAFSPDGRWALSGSDDWTLRLWEVASGRCVRTLGGHILSVDSVTYSPNGYHALSAGHDGALRLWMLNHVGKVDRPRVLVCKPRTAEELSRHVKAFGRLTARAREAWNLGEWARSACEIERAREQPGFSRDERALALKVELTAHLSRKALQAAWLRRTLQGHIASVRSIACSPDSKWILSGSMDKTLRLWEVASGECLRVFEGHSEGVVSVAFSYNGRWALSGSWDETIRLWEISSGQCLWTFQGHGTGVESIASSPDGQLVLSGDGSGVLCLWEASTGRCVQTFVQNPPYEGAPSAGAVFSVSFLPDGQHALSGGKSREIWLWKVASGRCVRAFSGHTAPVDSVACSPDGRWALSGCEDKIIRLWEVASGKLIRTLSGHASSVTSITFSPDSRWILSGSTDGTLRLWEVASAKCMRMFEEHAGSVESCAFSANGRWAVSGGVDKMVRLWELDWELDCSKE